MKEKECPYIIMGNAFEYCDIVKYRSIVNGALNATYSKQIYFRENPADLVDYFGQIKLLIKAAHTIHRFKNEIVLNGERNLFDGKYYCGKHRYISDWEYLPHSLTEEEYWEPCLVFKSFFSAMKFKKWKNVLKSILRYALSKEILNQDLPAINILFIYTHLMRLIEASHLLVVRRDISTCE